MQEQLDEETLYKVIAENPGDSRFVELARIFRRKGQPLRALEVLFAGLSVNSGVERGRLLLAQIFFDFGFIPFAVRELRELRQRNPGIDSIRRLLLRFDPTSAGESAAAAGAPGASAVRAEDTFAETEFDLDELELATKDAGKK